MRRAFVAGNWKMNGTSAGARELAAGICAALDGLSGVEVAICPPFVYMPTVAEALAGSPILLGAQTASAHDSGPFTGEVAPAMLSDIGCRLAIVGHSERRALYGESDSQVAAKFFNVAAHGLIPILCVGETLTEREAGETETVVSRQLGTVLDASDQAAFRGAIVAYEPVWAIGTGRTATPEQANDVHAHLRGVLNTHFAGLGDELRIIYGGSVNHSNAQALFAMSDIDGGLIGGASLQADDFSQICQLAG